MVILTRRFGTKYRSHFQGPISPSTFRDVSGPSSRIKKPFDVSTQRIGPIFEGKYVLRRFGTCRAHLQGSRIPSTFRQNVSVPSSRIKKSFDVSGTCRSRLQGSRSPLTFRHNVSVPSSSVEKPFDVSGQCIGPILKCRPR
jgi:hypothetical protein